MRNVYVVASLALAIILAGGCRKQPAIAPPAAVTPPASPVEVLFDVVQLEGKTEAEVAEILGPGGKREVWDYGFVGSPAYRHVNYGSPSDRFYIAVIFGLKTGKAFGALIDFVPPYPQCEETTLKNFNVDNGGGSRRLAWWSGRNDIWLCPQGNVKEYMFSREARTENLILLKVVFKNADYDIKGKEID